MFPVSADCAVIFAFIPQVWVGSVTEITVLELSAEDSDTPDEGLEFVVTPPSSGHLALKSAPSRHILNFTQHHIRSRQLLFAHSGQLLCLCSFQLFYLTFLTSSCLRAGALSGGFHFQVNDGVNFAPREIFSTTAEPLVLTLQRNRPLEVYPGLSSPWRLTCSAVVPRTDDMTVLLLPLKVLSHQSPGGTFRLSPATSKETSPWSSW